MSKRPSVEEESVSSSRRQSMMPPGAAGLRRGTLMGRKSLGMGRPSIWGLGIAGKKRLSHMFAPTVYENTYRLEAKDDERFRPKLVENLLKNTLETYLADVEYDQKTCVTLTKNITDIIRNKVKEMESVRYKIVCVVHIGQKNSGSASIGSRAVWMPESGDNYAEAKFESATLFAVATVYGLYFE